MKLIFQLLMKLFTACAWAAGGLNVVIFAALVSALFFGTLGIAAGALWFGFKWAAGL